MVKITYFFENLGKMFIISEIFSWRQTFLFIISGVIYEVKNRFPYKCSLQGGAELASHPIFAYNPQELAVNRKTRLSNYLLDFNKIMIIGFACE